MRCVRGSGHVSSFWTSRAGYVSEQKRYGQRGIRRIQKHATLMQARAGGLYQWRAPPGTMNEKVPADQEQGPVPVAGSPQLEKCRLQTHARGREKIAPPFQPVFHVLLYLSRKLLGLSFQQTLAPSGFRTRCNTLLLMQGWYAITSEVWEIVLRS